MFQGPHSALRPTWAEKSEGYTLEIPFYMSKIINITIEAPQRGLETNNYNSGLESVVLGAFQLERFADANGNIDLDSKEYKDFVAKTKEEVQVLAVEKELSSQTVAAMVAYAKIAHILEKVNAAKTKTGHLTI